MTSIFRLILIFLKIYGFGAINTSSISIIVIFIYHPSFSSCCTLQHSLHESQLGRFDQLFTHLFIFYNQFVSKGIFSRTKAQNQKIAKSFPWHLLFLQGSVQETQTTMQVCLRSANQSIVESYWVIQKLMVLFFKWLQITRIDHLLIWFFQKRQRLEGKIYLITLEIDRCL